MLIAKFFSKILNQKTFFVFLICFCLMLIKGCSDTKKVQVVNLTKPNRNQKWEHVVKSGETLYMIAWGNGLDYKKIARINNIQEPYNINKGQVLNLNYSDDSNIIPKNTKNNYFKKTQVKHIVKKYNNNNKWTYPLEKTANLKV